jgi:long-chain acyl-CoA synthetase
VATALVRDGVGVQDRVAYLGRNDPRLFGFPFGCALAGAVPTPAELADIVADSGAAVGIVDPELAGTLPLACLMRLDELEAWLGPAEDPGVPARPEHIAFQLYTSGTTGRRKGAMFANGTNLRVLLDDISGQWGFRPGDVSLLAMPLFHMGRWRGRWPGWPAGRAPGTSGTSTAPGASTWSTAPRT